jgi:hypothetical protein
MKVGLLTIEQKDALEGQLFRADNYFAPVQDNDDNWVISTQEMELNENPSFTWVSDLPLIDWNPKPVPPLG